ncbi:MAG: hypothetical protein PHX51_06215 [Clostridia bacterium]|nr:hypothetical protein [Clostridia bacterium]
MKKSVILVILVIYVISVVVVGYLGIKMKAYDEVVYAERIAVISDGVDVTQNTNTQYTDEGYPLIKIPFDVNKGVAVYQIEYRIYPDNATIKTVKFIGDSNDTVTLDAVTGIVTITEAWTSVTVTLESNDGKKLRTTVVLLTIIDV